MIFLSVVEVHSDKQNLDIERGGNFLYHSQVLE